MTTVRVCLTAAALVMALRAVTAQDSGPSGRPPEALVATAAVSERSHTISVGGRLEPLVRVEHQVTAAGTVLGVNVTEGQTVVEGQPLFSISKDELTGKYLPVQVSARVAGLVSAVAIRAEDEVSSGQAGVTVIGGSGYKLKATVSDKDAFKIEVGQPVVGRTPGGLELPGVLVYRSLEPDYVTGLFQLSFEFPDGQKTHVGEYLLIDLPVDSSRGIFVPRELVVRRYGRYYIWVVGAGDRLEAREVRLGEAFGEQVLILRGLAAGERYLTLLTGREKEGQAVGGRGE
jgi:multidrug efflux pump subunit AcrA (membrane-fusion protein)